MKYQMLTCLNIIIIVLLSASSSKALLDREVNELNTVLNKNFTSDQWENLSRLHLASLPEEQFPESFDKLKNLSIIDLLPEDSYIGCNEQELGAPRHTTNKNLQEKFKDQSICLSGRKFILIDKKGQGKMASVYVIEDPDTKIKYAFTRFDAPEGKNASGAMLVLSKARKSKNLLNLPLLVNTKEQYIISPLMMGDHVFDGSEKHIRFYPNGGCEKLIREDGIWSGLDTHDKNYMYATKTSELPKAIDFRTFKPLVTPPPISKYGPVISGINANPEYCKKIYDEQALSEKQLTRLPQISHHIEKAVITPVVKPELKPRDKEQCAKECHEQLLKCLATPQIDPYFSCGKQFTTCFSKCE